MDVVVPSSPRRDSRGGETSAKQQRAPISEALCVVLDVGDPRLKRLPVVRVRGKEYEVCWRSMFIFTVNGWFRRQVLALVEWKWFDRFILFLILINSILLAAYQYRAAEDDEFNQLVDQIFDPILTGFFTVEFLLKVIAWGFFLDPRSYLREFWNWLDFIVVVSALLSFFPAMDSGLGFLRLFRILRPLRSLNAVPQMKMLVNTVISSVPRLANVTIMMFFCFWIFGIIGLYLLEGIFYHGCHATPAPILRSDNTSTCWEWPYTGDSRLCGGRYSCDSPPDGVARGYCGGREDDPNTELRPHFPGGRQGYDWCVGSEPTKVFPETDFVHFDHMGGALLTVFQCMTMEGWTDIMYYVQDGYSFWVATIYFFTLIPITSFFLLNVALAVVDEAREDFKDAAEEEAAGKDNAKDEDGHRKLTAITENEDEDAEEERSPARGGEQSQESQRVSVAELDPEYWLDIAPVRALHAVAFNNTFLSVIMFFIAANVVTMMMEQFPPRVEWQDFFDVCEYSFLGIFTVEMLIMLGALGPKQYIRNPVTCLDGLIVVGSLIQVFATAGGSVLTALRTLRLSRVLNKLATRWTSFRVLLKAMVQTGISLNYWLVLFFLMLYIITLMCMSFFKKSLHFADTDGFATVSASQGQPWCEGSDHEVDVAFRQDCIPRANFDTFLWSLVTVFQIMTGENWNWIMYSTMRAQHWAFAGVFVCIIVFGQILFLSLFLSMLMSKFDEVQDHLEHVENEKLLLKRASQEQVRGSLIRWQAPWHRFTQRSSAVRGSQNDLMFPVDVTSVDSPSPESPLSEATCNNVLEDHIVKVLPGQLDDDNPSCAESEREALSQSEQTASRNWKEVNLPMVPVPTQEADAGAGPANVQTPPPPPQQVRHPSDSPADMELPDASPPPSRERPGMSASRPSASSGDRAERPRVVPADMPKSTGVVGAAELRPEAPRSGKVPARKSWPRGYALFILSETNPIRQVCRWILEKRVHVRGTSINAFDNFVLLCILVSTVGMALDYPLRDPTDRVTQVIRQADPIFAYIFAGEMAIKLLALGLIWGKGAYLKSGWNWLDGVVVCIALLGMFSNGSGGFLKTLRILRAFRPLRVISRNQNLKVVVQTIFASLPALLTLVIVCVVFLLIFALFALSYLNGTFYQCSQDEGVQPRMMRDLGAAMPVIPLCLMPNLTNLPVHSACARGRWDEALRTWSLDSLGCPAGNSSCDQGMSQASTLAWQRTTADTPICVGRCSLQPSGTAPSWLCPRRYETLEELPHNCGSGETRSISPELLQHEAVGQAYVESMTRNIVMPCSGSAVGSSGVDFPAAATSCRSVFCPAGVSAEKVASCEAQCRRHPHFCLETCKGTGESSLECTACRAECQAACECEEHCEPLMKDAAVCVEQGGTWGPSLPQNFNNIWNSLLTLFEISSTEAWVDVMYAACDAVGPYEAPVRNNQQWVFAPFFMVYLFMSFMFLLNLSVGVIVDNFMDLKQELSRQGQDMMLTPAQQKWINSRLTLFRRPVLFNLTNLHKLTPRRRMVYDWISTNWFEATMTGAIVANTLVMASKIYPAPTSWWEEVLQKIDYPFTVIFAVEFGLKYFALRRSYWKVSWNCFDFLCVVAAITGLVLHTAAPDFQFGASLTQLFRIFRIARLFRLVRSQRLNTIFTALVLSLPKLANVLMILLLLLILYSILGVSLFSIAKHSEYLNSHGNFGNFGWAFITLFRAVTGEAWNSIMHDLLKGEQDFFREGSWCAPDSLYDASTEDGFAVLTAKCLIENPNSCVQTIAGWNVLPAIFWTTYILVICLMVMNLVIAVILEGYEDGKTRPEDEVVEICIKCWRKYDSDHKMALPLKEAMHFIFEVVSEWAHRQGKEAATATANITLSNDIARIPMKNANAMQLSLTIDGRVGFIEASKEVLRFTCIEDDSSVLHEIDGCERLMDKREAERLKRLELRKSKQLHANLEHNDLRLLVAVVKLQRNYRKLVQDRKRWVLEEVK